MYHSLSSETRASTIASSKPAIFSADFRTPTADGMMSAATHRAAYSSAPLSATGFVEHTKTLSYLDVKLEAI